MQAYSLPGAECCLWAFRYATEYYGGDEAVAIGGEYRGYARGAFARDLIAPLRENVWNFPVVPRELIAAEIDLSHHVPHCACWYAQSGIHLPDTQNECSCQIAIFPQYRGPYCQYFIETARRFSARALKSVNHGGWGGTSHKYAHGFCHSSNIIVAQGVCTVLLMDMDNEA
jgi:hypothetical protein